MPRGCPLRAPFFQIFPNACCSNNSPKGTQYFVRTCRRDVPEQPSARGNHSSGSQPNGAAFSWTNTTSALWTPGATARPAYLRGQLSLPFPPPHHACLPPLLRLPKLSQLLRREGKRIWPLPNSPHPSVTGDKTATL